MAVQVAVGVVLDAERRVLLARRADDAHQGGLWEFPGGKVEEGERFAEALERELREELGIRPLQTTPLLAIRHDYPDKSVWLDVHVVWEFTGQARGLEGQPLAWVSAEALGNYAFPAANEPIVAAIQGLLAG